jgi:TPR repeat protein
MTAQTVDNGKAEATNMFKQANETFRSAMETGIRFQQDAFRSVADAFGRGESFDEARNRIETAATDSLTLIRKNAEQSQKLFDEGCKAGIDLFRKTFEALEPSRSRDAFAQARDFWTGAFDALRSNIDAAARASTQAIDNWSAFFSKNVAGPERKAAK